MKIYLFSSETGIYQGEDFADAMPMKPGCYLVPPDATVIAPPSCGHGETPVFDAALERWEIRRFPAAPSNCQPGLQRTDQSDQKRQVSAALTR